MDIAVVLVTYNRLEDLKRAIKSYEQQTKLMNSMIIVNNASKDGTSEFLKEWEQRKASFEKIVINSETNLGGSGGFCLGLEKAKHIECDYVFLADDDAFADKDVMENLENVHNVIAESNDIAALCTSVINHGKFDLMHRRRVKLGAVLIKQVWISEEEYSKEFFEVDELSFVGAVIKKSVVERIGLPLKDYFIYFDDTEYSARIKDTGKIYCIPSCKMQHDSESDDKITWRNYYVQRNYLDHIRRHYSKRYYICQLIWDYFKRGTCLAKVFKNRTRSERKMHRVAISDSIKGKLGISNIYKPGVDIEKL